MPLTPHPSSCRSCPLDAPISIGGVLTSRGKGFMSTEGSGSLGVMAIAEALGDTEAKDSLPLRPYAPSGSVFERTIRSLGISREQLALSNIIHCQPPKNLLEHQEYEHGAINHCVDAHLAKEIETFRPRALFAMGNVPLRTLTGWAGRKRQVTNVRGFVLPGSRFPGIPVISSYHPAYISRDKSNLLGVFRNDIQLALKIAQRGYTPYKGEYKIFPNIHEAEEWFKLLCLHPEWEVSYDIETIESMSEVDESSLRVMGDGRVQITTLKPEYTDSAEHILEDKGINEDDTVEKQEYVHTRITQIQFSHLPGQAIVLPWEGPFIDLAKRVMVLPNAKLGFNSWGFDDPILRMAGVHLAGRLHDLMWAWHHYQPDIPRGLQYVTSFHLPEMEPWKHLADSDAGHYGGCDVDAPRTFAGPLFRSLEQAGVLRGYERYLFRFHSCMEGAATLGVPVDNQARGELGGELTLQMEEVLGELQQVFPDELRRCEPKEGYVNPTLVAKAKAKMLEPGEKWTEKQFKAKTGEMVTRWCRLQPFSPNSGPQILAYIKHKRAEDIQERMTREARRQTREVAERNTPWKVPKDKKKDTETTAKTELEKLGKATADPLFKKVIEYRELRKLYSTYVQGWAPAADGRVHTTFTYAPATGQLSSRNPNVQNSPKHNARLANKFRNIIAALPKHVLIEFDKRAFHALTLGYEAKDPDYMRIAARDIHSYVTCHFIQHPDRNRILGWTDGEMDQFFEHLKADKTTLYHGQTFKWIRDKQSKPSILGIGFGMGYKKLFDMNQESFAAPADAKKFQDLLKGLFPKIFIYQEAQRKKAHHQKRLVTAHGFQRWFWDVFHWDSKRAQMVPGADSEAAIAFEPANDAFGMIREETILMDEQGWLERYGFINNLHDALMFCCREDLADECLRNVGGIMASPSKVLVCPIVAPAGLKCGVEAAWGPRWSQMEKATLEGVLL